MAPFPCGSHFSCPCSSPLAEGATHTSGTGVTCDRVEDLQALVLTQTYHPGHMAPDDPAMTGIETLRPFHDGSVASGLMGPGSWIRLDHDIVVSLPEDDTISFDQTPPPEAGPGCSLDAPAGSGPRQRRIRARRAGPDSGCADVLSERATQHPPSEQSEAGEGLRQVVLRRLTPPPNAWVTAC